MKIGNLEVYGIIYKIENLVNKKVYIGQTTEEKGFDGRYCRKGKDIERIYKHQESLKENNYKYNKHLLDAINKYGHDNFIVDKIFDIAFSKKELNIKEQVWISIYNSYNNGYNNNLGGDGNKGFEGLKGELNPTCRKVVQLSLDGDFIKEWKYIEEASESLNINKAHICSMCGNNYGRKSTGGYIWMYKEDYEIMNDKSLIEYVDDRGKYNQNPVVQMSLQGDFIQEFESMAQATRLVVGSSVDKISKCCKRERKSHNGYLWIYKNDFINNNIPKYKAIHNGKSKSIIQLSLDMKFISEFNSVTEAISNTGITRKIIDKSLKNIDKNGGNYFWIYKEDYNKKVI